jgi:hypothetical protein
MAEFQMWTGQTLDTDNIETRRLFLDFKRDALGTPIPASGGAIGLMPIDPRVPASVFGPQTVLLTRTSNWQQGKNTGTTGGRFTPVGTILPYPDPIILTG